MLLIITAALGDCGRSFPRQPGVQPADVDAQRQRPPDAAAQNRAVCRAAQGRGRGRHGHRPPMMQVCAAVKHPPHVHIMRMRLMTPSLAPADCGVTRYGSPWQCQDFLSGQETGGGRKSMSTWSPLAVMSYANSQSEPVEADSSLVHSEETTVFQKKDLKKKRCEKKKMLDLFCNIIMIIIIIILMIMIINIIDYYSIYYYYHGSD